MKSPKAIYTITLLLKKVRRFNFYVVFPSGTDRQADRQTGTQSQLPNSRERDHSLPRLNEQLTVGQFVCLLSEGITEKESEVARPNVRPCPSKKKLHSTYVKDSQKFHPGLWRLARSLGRSRCIRTYVRAYLGVPSSSIVSILPWRYFLFSTECVLHTYVRLYIASGGFALI